MNGPLDKPDLPWQDGWDVLVDWEVDLMKRQREREEFLGQYRGKPGPDGGTPGPSWTGTQVGAASPVSGIATTPTTTTAVSTGGA